MAGLYTLFLNGTPHLGTGFIYPEEAMQSAIGLVKSL